MGGQIAGQVFEKGGYPGIVFSGCFFDIIPVQIVSAIVAVALLFGLTATGISEWFIYYNLNTHKGGYIELHPDSQIAEWVTKNTNEDDIFLTPMWSTDDFFLSGRRVYYGWPYFAWSAGHDTETAYEAWHGKSKNGYGLWLWENGSKRRLTSGRCRDYTPAVSPDGRKVYFVTTRGVTSESSAYSKAASSRIAELDLAGSGEPRILMDSPNGNNSGFVQPAVSPDGTMLVWGHLENFFDKWRIFGTRIGRFGRQEWCPVTPRSLAAISPRWHPDGKLICFSGFRKGDPGWGVWVEEVATGKVKRLVTGENPCFSPDGKFLAYDRDGTIYVRPFGTICRMRSCRKCMMTWSRKRCCGRRRT